MQSLQEHLLSLEQKLIHPQIRKSLDELNALLADDFIEFGSSGGVVNKLTAIEGMLAESPLSAIISDLDSGTGTKCSISHLSFMSSQRHAVCIAKFHLEPERWKVADMLSSRHYYTPS